MSEKQDSETERVANGYVIPIVLIFLMLGLVVGNHLIGMYQSSGLTLETVGIGLVAFVVMNSGLYLTLSFSGTSEVPRYD